MTPFMHQSAVVLSTQVAPSVHFIPAFHLHDGTVAKRTSTPNIQGRGCLLLRTPLYLLHPGSGAAPDRLTFAATRYLAAKWTSITAPSRSTPRSSLNTNRARSTSQLPSSQRGASLL